MCNWSYNAEVLRWWKRGILSARETEMMGNTMNRQLGHNNDNFGKVNYDNYDNFGKVSKVNYYE